MSVFSIRLSDDFKKILQQIPKKEIVFLLQNFVNDKLESQRLCASCHKLIDIKAFNNSDVCLNCTSINSSIVDGKLKGKFKSIDFSSLDFGEFHKLVEEFKSIKVAGDDLPTVNEFIEKKYSKSTYYRKLKENMV